MADNKLKIVLKNIFGTNYNITIKIDVWLFV